MYQLPDGSGFFISTFGERPSGLVNWLKYNKDGMARTWLWRYRNFVDAYTGIGGIVEPVSLWKAIKYALL